MTDSPKENAAAAPDEVDNEAARSLDALVNLGLPQASNSKLLARIRPLARDLLAQLAPDDATGRMLAVQMIATFGRSMFLSRHANMQKHPQWFELYSGECDRAMKLFCRQLQMFTDLHRPRRTSFTSIRQANIAGQQVVITSPPDSTSNSTVVRDAQPVQKQAPALPPEQKRPGRPPCQRPEEPPLAT